MGGLTSHIPTYPTLTSTKSPHTSARFATPLWPNHDAANSEDKKEIERARFVEARRNAAASTCRKGSEDGVNAVEISVSSITTRGPYTTTPVNITMSEISPSRLLKEVIKRGYPDFNMQTYVFTYLSGSESHNTVVINYDSNLYAGTLYLRKTLLKGMEVSEAAEIELCLASRSLNPV